ncbi:MAG TPA: Gfo/Idh/MocA family oxidoreductase [Patescibacteria group bacterium]|nr:Gfo/Idh/MocA family oxidoreductase [Patescibacteria group bacterium]
MTSSEPAPAPWRPGATPIRVGIVGLGNVGLGHHVPALLAIRDLARVVAVADPSAERRDLAVTALGLAADAAAASPDELLARDDLDVIDLATPPDVRPDLALRAIASGRAVVCEKPIALAPADGARIAAASRKTGVPAAVIHNYLGLPEIVAARAAIDAGSIGRPDLAILNYLGVEDRPGSAAWRPNWRHDPSVAGGGVLMDMLHVVYVAEALLGRPFHAVSAQVMGRTEGARVEDLAVCRFDAEGAIALVNVGWGFGPGGIAVAGPGGRIEIGYEGGGTGPFAALSSVRLTTTDGRVSDLTPALPPRGAPIDVRMADAFRTLFERLAAGRPPVATADDAVRALEGVLGAYSSATTGRSVALPLGPDDPVHRSGIVGLADLDLDPHGPIGRSGLYGVSITH